MSSCLPHCQSVNVINEIMKMSLCKKYISYTLYVTELALHCVVCKFCLVIKKSASIVLHKAVVGIFYRFFI